MDDPSVNQRGGPDAYSGQGIIMGREVKRVPLDFVWPMHKTYDGFLLPKELEALPCHCARGLAPESDVFFNQWYGYAYFDPIAYGSTLITAETPGIYDHIKTKIGRNLSFYKEFAATDNEDYAIQHEIARMCQIWNSQWHYHLTQADVDDLFNNDDMQRYTHRFIDGEYKRVIMTSPDAAVINFNSIEDAFCKIDVSRCIEHRAKREGVPSYCATCNGENALWRDVDHKAAHDAWTPIGPPVGDGYQLWENTSEGSPISPVKEAPEELATWLVENEASRFGDKTATFEEWMSVINAGWVPSMIIERE